MRRVRIVATINLVGGIRQTPLSGSGHHHGSKEIRERLPKGAKRYKHLCKCSEERRTTSSSIFINIISNVYTLSTFCTFFFSSELSDSFCIHNYMKLLKHLILRGGSSLSWVCVLLHISSYNLCFYWNFQIGFPILAAVNIISCK